MKSWGQADNVEVNTRKIWNENFKNKSVLKGEIKEIFYPLPDLKADELVEVEQYSSPGPGSGPGSPSNAYPWTSPRNISPNIFIIGRNIIPSKTKENRWSFGYKSAWADVPYANRAITSKMIKKKKSVIICFDFDEKVPCVILKNYETVFPRDREKFKSFDYWKYLILLKQT